MCSRIIIEQKIADLEVALQRQEELIRSQKDVLRGLKELIANEYATQWQSPPSQSYLQQGIALSNTVGVSSPFVASMINQGNEEIIPANIIGTSHVTITPGKKLLTKADHGADSLGEPNKKKQKLNSSLNSDDSSLRDNKNVTQRHTHAHHDNNVSIANLSGHLLNHSSSSSNQHGYPVAYSPPFGSTKRRRALDKVAQFVSQLPGILTPYKPVPRSAHSNQFTSIAMPNTKPPTHSNPTNTLSLSLSNPHTAHVQKNTSSTQSSRAPTPQEQKVSARSTPVPVHQSSLHSSPEHHRKASEPEVVHTTKPIAQKSTATTAASSSSAGMILSNKVRSSLAPNSRAIAALPANATATTAAATTVGEDKRDSYMNISYLESIESMDCRLEVMKEWTTMFAIQPKDTKKLLDHNEKYRILFSAWLNDINTDRSPTKEVALLIEYLLQMIRCITWTDAQICLYRIDKPLRRIFKKWRLHKEIISNHLIEIIRSMWVEYRSMYKQASREDDEDEDGGEGGGGKSRTASVNDE